MKIQNWEELSNYFSEAVQLTQQESQLLLDYTEGCGCELHLQDGRLLKGTQNTECFSETKLEELLLGAIEWCEHLVILTRDELSSPENLETYYMAYCSQKKYLNQADMLFGIVQKL